jgi:hypothetical protein
MEITTCNWKMALVIGIGGYGNDQHVLRNAEQDALTFAARLRALGCEVQECINPNRYGTRTLSSVSLNMIRPPPGSGIHMIPLNRFLMLVPCWFQLGQ